LIANVVRATTAASAMLRQVRGWLIFSIIQGVDFDSETDLSMARANSVFVFLPTLFLDPLNVSSWKGLVFANKYKKAGGFPPALCVS